MYFDNLTIVSVVIFVIAFGSFIYACVIRGCMTESAERKQDKPDNDDRHDQSKQ